MRADICEADDEFAVERFRRALARLGADLSAKSWGLGVDVYSVSIQGEELRIFRDSWSVDIEGSERVVRAVLKEMRGK